MNEITIVDADSKPVKNQHHCNPFDFYAVHYEGYLGTSEHKVYDSRLYGLGKPKQFHQGFFEVVKCWDMAVYLMSSGESIEIVCPPVYANGAVRTYGHFDHEQIPANSEIRYKIEVMECESDLDKFN